EKLQKLRLQNEQEITRLKAGMEGEEKERQRIARELHDGIMVQLSVAQMNLSALAEQNNSREKEKIERVLEQLEKTTGDLRKTAHNLLPDMLLLDGLAEAAHYFCKTIQRDTGILVNFQLIGELPPLAPEYE